jgi:hypothetical protein
MFPSEASFFANSLNVRRRIFPEALKVGVRLFQIPSQRQWMTVQNQPFWNRIDNDHTTTEKLVMGHLCFDPFLYFLSEGSRRLWIFQ